jgi:biotin synthase
MADGRAGRLSDTNVFAGLRLKGYGQTSPSDGVEFRVSRRRVTSVEDLIAEVVSGSSHAIARALSLRGDDQRALFLAARAVRDERIGQAVTLRGVIELTNLCRVACSYCPMRKGSVRSEYFVLSKDDISRAIEHIADAPIDVISFQSGETRKVIEAAEFGISAAARLVDRSILLCLGSYELETYERFFELGADSYIMKFETSDADLHLSTRGEALNRRLQHIRLLKSLGYRVGTGSIVGLPGQSNRSIVDDLLLARELKTEMVSVSPFIPAHGTPLAGAPAGDADTTLNAIAILRLLAPTADIPAVSALEIDGQYGQVSGLMAGANVLTINYTPDKEARLYGIYGRDRFRVGLHHGLDVISRAGLTPKSDAPLLGHSTATKKESGDTIDNPSSPV